MLTASVSRILFWYVLGLPDCSILYVQSVPEGDPMAQMGLWMTGRGWGGVYNSSMMRLLCAAARVIP